MEWTYFHLSLVHTSAAIFQVSAPPRLVLGAHGTIAPATIEERVREASGEARGAMRWAAGLEGGDASRAVTLSRGDVERLVQRLDALGPAPRLDGVVDTSDGHAVTHLAGGRTDAAGRIVPFQVTLSQMASGYRGPSAGAFAELCRALLELAGLPAGPIWDDLVLRCRA